MSRFFAAAKRLPASARTRSLRFDRLEDRRMLAWGVGDLDPSFGNGGRLELAPVLSLEGNESLYDYIQLADGKVLALIYTAKTDGSASGSRLARYLPTGQLDTTYGGGTGIVDLSSLQVQPLQMERQGENVILADVAGGNPIFVRFSLEGVWDQTFGLGDFGPGYAYIPGTSGSGNFSGVPLPMGWGDLVVTEDAIFIGGPVFDSTSTPYPFAFIAKFSPSGIPDATFDGDGVRLASIGNDEQWDFATDLAVHGGKIYLSGSSSGGGANRYWVARFNADGSDDTSFAQNGTLFLSTPLGIGSSPDREVTALPSGNTLTVVVNADEGQGADGTKVFVGQYSLTANQWISSFGTSGVAAVDFGIPFYSVASTLDPAGNVLIAANQPGGLTKLARVTAGGAIDTAFGTLGFTNLPLDFLAGVLPGLTYIPPALQMTSNGNILIGGGWLAGPGDSNAALVRVIGNPDLDGDGIQNSVDTQPTTSSNAFSDVASGGTTTGHIVTRGDQVVTIADAPNPSHGVTVSTAAGGGAAPAVVYVDAGTGQGGANHTFGAGASWNSTTGSVNTQVLAGSVLVTYLVTSGHTNQVVATATLPVGTDVTFEPDTVTFVANADSQPVEVALIGVGGQQAVATIAAENEITFEPQTFTFTAPEGNSEPIEVVIDGAPVTVAPGATVRPVQIDIRPGEAVNTLNLSSNGVIAVAILSSANFDARSVVANSVVFAGAHAVQSATRDVNGDGRLDLVLNFRTQDTNLRALYAQLLADDINQDGVLDSSHQVASISLTGETVDQVLIEGFDSLDLFLAGRSLRILLDQLAASGAI